MHGRYAQYPHQRDQGVRGNRSGPHQFALVSVAHIVPQRDQCCQYRDTFPRSSEQRCAYARRMDSRRITPGVSRIIVSATRSWRGSAMSILPLKNVRNPCISSDCRLDCCKSYSAYRCSPPRNRTFLRPSALHNLFTLPFISVLR